MESTLTCKKSDFEGRIGDFFGWGFGADKGDRPWTDREKIRIKDCIDSGCRQFYHPPPSSGFNAYDWSFLKPFAALALPASETLVPLPDDFGGFISRVTISSTQGQVWYPIEQYNEAWIKAQYATSGTSPSGKPLAFAIAAGKNPKPDASPRQFLQVYPTSDAEYELQFQYYILADAIRDSLPFAYGGMAHSETIIESCLYIAEHRYDDNPNGPHKDKFFERLAASVLHDRRFKAAKIGYNGDNSDGREWSRQDQHLLTRVTYNGSTM